MMIGPRLAVQRFAPCGDEIAKIQGLSTSVVKAAGGTLSWKNDGLAVRQYMEQKVITDEYDELDASKHILVTSEASLDALLIEASRFFILKALNSDTAAPMMPAEPQTPQTLAGFGAQLSPSWEVDQV